MIDCVRCLTGKMVVSRENRILAKCVNCSHEIVEMYFPSPTTAMWIAKARAEQRRINEQSKPAQVKRAETLAHKRRMKG